MVWSPTPWEGRLDVKKRFTEEQIIGFLRESDDAQASNPADGLR